MTQTDLAAFTLYTSSPLNDAPGSYLIVSKFQTGASTSIAVMPAENVSKILNRFVHLGCQTQTQQTGLMAGELLLAWERLWSLWLQPHLQCGSASPNHQLGLSHSERLRYTITTKYILKRRTYFAAACKMMFGYVEQIISFHLFIKFCNSYPQIRPMASTANNPD